MNPRHPNFVESNAAGSRQDTAALLVGTAREFGISQHDIKTSGRGFYISDALADVLEAEADEVDDIEEEITRAGVDEILDDVSGNTRSSGTGSGNKKQKKGK